MTQLPRFIRFARMAGSTIAAPGAAGWVTDFLNAAYYARDESSATSPTSAWLMGSSPPGGPSTTAGGSERPTSSPSTRPKDGCACVAAVASTTRAHGGRGGAPRTLVL